MNVEAVVTRVAEYLTIPAVVGFERPFLDRLEAELSDLGREVERSPRSIVSRGRGPLTLSAHVDRHGLITRSDGRVSYAASAAAGAHRPLRPPSPATLCDRFAGETVVAYLPDTGRVLASGTVDHAQHCGVGPDVRLLVEAFADLEAGCPVAFASAFDADELWVRGQLDNCVTVALAMELLAEGLDAPVAFTCGEEAGRSWPGLIVLGKVSGTKLIVLDTSPFDDEAVPRSATVVLRRADAGGAFDPDLTGRVTVLSERLGRPWVFKDEVLASAGRPLGRTELGRVVEGSAGAVTGTTVQVPTTDYHSNREATTRTAIEAVGEVLVELFGG